MHYTSVLFDLDGTLLDTLGDLTAAMNRTLTRHGLPERTRQQMRTALGNGARRLMELSVPSGTDSALFETLLAEYNADYAAHCRIETCPLPRRRRAAAHAAHAGAQARHCVQQAGRGRARTACGFLRRRSPDRCRRDGSHPAQAGTGHAAGRHGTARRRSRRNGLCRRFRGRYCHGARSRSAVHQRAVGLS